MLLRGANLRLGSLEAPVGCMRKGLRLHSGKSIIQLLCERVRRIAELCRNTELGKFREKRGEPSVKATDKKAGRASIPVFVMTSRLTHRAVVEHFESNSYFGLPSRDVFFFEQPVYPVLDEAGHLLPQSLGGDFAHLPGGTGQVLPSLVGSLGLERLRDRGVECLHILGTENLTAKVCDPAFMGFCRDLDVDCACKVVERSDVSEDLELFCIRQSPVSSAYADIEEAACGLDPSVASFEMLTRRTKTGEFAFSGSINSVYMTVSYIEEVVDRRLKALVMARPVPYLDFHPERISPRSCRLEEQVGSPWGKVSRPAGGVAPGCWPAEALSPDLSSQRALMAAAAEVSSQRRAVAARAPDGEASRSPGAPDVVQVEEEEDNDPDAPWRCDVHLDCGGPVAVVRVRSARSGPAALKRSLAGPRGCAEASAAVSAAQAVATAEAEGVPAAALGAEEWLRCSLVVPTRPNAWVLETSILDYFAFTDRAVALQVSRSSEFAPVRAVQGLHSVQDARRMLHSLHLSWLMRAGITVAELSSDPDALLEVSPLLSYEGEGLEGLIEGDLAGNVQVPVHVMCQNEDMPDEGQDVTCSVADETAEGLDTRPFYLQEYPLRPEVSCSHAPRFLAAASGTDAVPGEDTGERAVPCEPGISSLAQAVAPALSC
mmetsp:Transcript_86529/g.258231  ORF Transcript_86529/g.258231 Transcript_86529/m.258231 type:complete len:659 (-) Transcript_86529:35-2011(-)